jgi:hypothetical protein
MPNIVMVDYATPVAAVLDMILIHISTSIPMLGYVHRWSNLDLRTSILIDMADRSMVGCNCCRIWVGKRLTQGRRSGESVTFPNIAWMMGAMMLGVYTRVTMIKHMMLQVIRIIIDNRNMFKVGDGRAVVVFDVDTLFCIVVLFIVRKLARRAN